MNRDETAEDSDVRDVWDLRGISTQWSAVSDANAFVLRYVNAIEQYLQKLLRNEDDVEDVLQQFLVKVLENGFSRASPDRGRFRFYLIRAVKNEVITWQRKQSRRKSLSIDRLPEPEESPTSDEWDQEWQQCVLDRCWLDLRQREAETPGNLCFTALRTATEEPNLRSEAAAERVSNASGRPLTAAAYRKQLSRARRMFAETLIREVSETLDNPTRESVESELSELGLMGYLQNYLD